MSATVGAPKRHRGNRLGERRGNREATSSQDASEEDNDASDVGSLLSVHATTSIVHPVASPKMAQQANLHAQPSATVPVPVAVRKALGAKKGDELSGEGSMSEGPDSTYDGDIESASTIGGTPIHPAHHQSHHPRRTSSPTPHGLTPDTPLPISASPSASHRLPTPKASRANLADLPPVPDHHLPADVVVQKSRSLPEPKRSQTDPLAPKGPNSVAGPPKMHTLPQELSLEDIRGFVQRAIEGRGGEDGVERWWKTNDSPDGKVVRVYADGVYDLFHFGHALQLRQAKLSFPRVHLLVGVCSDALCASHKSAPAMTHAERCESVRHCRWADEVLPDAPWVVDQAWLDKHVIDYIAHDEFVYPSKGLDDVYAFAKKSGRFVPTRRTPAISTSDLLERIVRGYRDGFFDSKLEKNGHPELLAADVDWDSSASVGKRESRAARGK